MLVNDRMNVLIVTKSRNPSFTSSLNPTKRDSICAFIYDNLDEEPTRLEVDNLTIDYNLTNQEIMGWTEDSVWVSDLDNRNQIYRPKNLNSKLKDFSVTIQHVDAQHRVTTK